MLWIFLPDEPVKILAGKVLFRAQKHIQNQVALRGALEPCSDMLEKTSCSSVIGWDEGCGLYYNFLPLILH